MASELIRRMRDDIDGTPDDTGELVKTYKFGWGGVDYEIDLTQANAEAFTKAISPFVEAARRVPRKRKTDKVKQQDQEPVRVPSRNDRVREWAATNGYVCPSMGRIPRHIVEAYDTAQRFPKESA